jgi:hypothetical protein
MPYEGRQRDLRRPHTAIDLQAEHIPDPIANGIAMRDGVLSIRGSQFGFVFEKNDAKYPTNSQ